MPRRPRAVTRPPFLSSAVGHVTRAPERFLAPADAIEAFPERVASALRASAAHGREVGFLAYAPGEPGLPLVPEDDAEGGARDIKWHWREPHAAVAFSFHTHPGTRAMCVPSGIDAVGALVRGDHVIYVLTMDGRLSGWRFRDRTGLAWAVEDAMSSLDEAESLKRGFIEFLYDAFDAMRDDVMEPVYAARVAPGGGRFERAPPARPFFTEAEWPR